MRSELEFEKPRRYQIRLSGHINHDWKEWLDGLVITYEKHGATVMTGAVADQPQLFGLLLKIRDLGLSLVSVAEINDEPEGESITSNRFGLLERGIVLERQFQLHSETLEEDRHILIALPGRYYEGAERYPVLYQLDGYESLFQLAVGTIRYLSEWEEVIPPIILVSIPNTDRDRDVFPTQATLSSGETVGGGADNFLKFIEAELGPYVDEHFRTLPNRILFGTSNSGLTAIYALLIQSRMFDAFIASSPTLSWDKNFIFRKAESVFKVWQPAQRFLYMICGREDIGNICQANLDFATLLADHSPARLTWGFDVSDEVRHCPYRSLHDGLMKLFSEWNYAGKKVFIANKTSCPSSEKN